MKLFSTLLILSCLARALADDATLLSRVLQEADANEDGKLSLQEYKRLDVQAKHHGDEHFNASDANGDGFIDSSELNASLRKQTWFAILSEGIEPCFIRLDSDKDEKLNSAEYRKISRMGAHAQQHFKAADADKDGFLNRVEFAIHAEAKLKSLKASSQKNAKG